MGHATLSLTTSSFPTGELKACLEWVAHLGLSGVEIGPHESQPLFEQGESAVKQTKDLFASLGIRPLSVHAWTQVEGLEDVCEFTRQLGAGLVVVHCRDESIVNDFENQVAMLKRWDAWCRDRDIIIAVENSSMQPLEPFVRLFKAIPELRMTLDVKHAYKPEKLGLTYLDYMRELGDRPANFHISGIDWAREQLGDGTPPGNDAISWDDLAADLALREYGGLITMEVILPEYLSVEEQEQAYFDLPKPTPGCSSISQRLTQHSAEFFRKKFAPVLGR